MKQTNVVKVIATMAVSVLSFTITSCSSDNFYGFDFNLDEYDNTNNLLKFNNEPFLNISTSDFNKMTDSDYKNLSNAICRIKNNFGNGTFLETQSINYNISDSLFLLAYSTLENTQNFCLSFTNKLNKRAKTNNREESFVISGKDCVGQAIAYSLSLDIDKTNSILANKFKDYYSSGVPYESLEDAFAECNANNTANTTLYDTNTSTSSTKDVLIIKPEDDDYHAMNILSIQNDNNIYHVYARDKNYSSVCFDLNGSSLPRLFWNGGNKFTMVCYHHLTKKKQ